jgi:hypothetical protein
MTIWPLFSFIRFVMFRVFFVLFGGGGGGLYFLGRKKWGQFCIFWGDFCDFLGGFLFLVSAFFDPLFLYLNKAIIKILVRNKDNSFFLFIFSFTFRHVIPF